MNIMKNKYYTPDITEFRVGFEYEYCIYPETSEKFNKEIMNWAMLDILYDDYEHEPKELFERTYRVKYLDIEDIESLGLSKDIYIEFLQHVTNEEPNIIIKPKGIYGYFFKGRVKNISELKQILTMIGVDYVK